MKGDYKEECNRTVCKQTNAEYYNESTRMYYCKSCAKEINYWSLLDAGYELCKKQE